MFRSSRSTPTILVLLLASLGLFGVMVERRDATPVPDTGECLDAGPECRTPAWSFAPSAPTQRLAADDVCRSAGYLCAEIDQTGSVHVRRWRDFSGTIVVHVPAPTFENSAVARELQRAAAAGIRAWNGQPYPVAVDERGTRQAHFAVRWSQVVSGGALGQARTRWSTATGLEVVDITLSTRVPSRTDRTIDPRQLRLTAAHEMGHALGLPHSDAPRDMMYPTNTANAPSAQDYKTLEVLYSLPDGAEIIR